jgi:hypothetical protein
MDGERFDDLTRRMATGSTSRRRLLRNLGGTAAGAMLAGFGMRSASAVTQDSTEGAHVINGRRAGQALREQGGGMCDNCAPMCTNCPLGCCGA